jgi:hypothetical protein
MNFQLVKKNPGQFIIIVLAGVQGDFNQPVVKMEPYRPAYS